MASQKKLTTKQQAFVDYYVETGNVKEAMRKAGYCDTNSGRMMEYPAIKAAVKERMDQLASKRIASAQEVLEYLTAVMRGEIKEIKQVYNEYTGETDAIESDPKIADRTKAAELLGKRHGLFTDHVNLSGASVVQIVDDIQGDIDG